MKRLAARWVLPICVGSFLVIAVISQAARRRAQPLVPSTMRDGEGGAAAKAIATDTAAGTSPATAHESCLQSIRDAVSAGRRPRALARAVAELAFRLFSQEREAILSELRRALQEDGDPKVRICCSFLLGAHGDGREHELLVSRLDAEADAAVLHALLWSLKMGDPIRDPDRWAPMTVDKYADMLAHLWLSFTIFYPTMRAVKEDWGAALQDSGPVFGKYHLRSVESNGMDQRCLLTRIPELAVVDVYLRFALDASKPVVLRKEAAKLIFRAEGEAVPRVAESLAKCDDMGVKNALLLQIGRLPPEYADSVVDQLVRNLRELSTDRDDGTPFRGSLTQAVAGYLSAPARFETALDLLRTHPRREVRDELARAIILATPARGEDPAQRYRNQCQVIREYPDPDYAEWLLFQMKMDLDGWVRSEVHRRYFSKGRTDKLIEATNLLSRVGTADDAAFLRRLAESDPGNAERYRLGADAILRRLHR